MKSRLVLSGVVTMLAASAAVAVLAWPASGHSTRTIHFFEASAGGNGVEVDATDSKATVGDYVVFHSKVLDRKGGAVVGQINATCLHGHFKDYCQGTLLFNGRGVLAFYGLGSLTDKPHIDRFAITGGTAEFLGVGGEMSFDSTKEDPAGIAWTAVLVG